MAAREFSHYVPWDQLGRGLVLALCGARIRRTGHTDAPTCPACQQHLRDGDLTSAATPDPEAPPPVAHVPFNPVTGYTPRGK